MSIPMDTYCINCQLQRNLKLVRSLGSEEKATEFIRRWMDLLLKQPPEAPSPCMDPQTSQLLYEMYGVPLDRYHEEKVQANSFAFAHLADVRQRVEAAQDPVYAGLQFAILGNYLDFSALQGKVSFQDLQQMLDKANDISFDADTYASFRACLAKSKSLLYLTDNAGEIIFDRVLAEELHKAYPELAITFCVRGGIAANDATREDAAAAGIPFPVIDNGNLVTGTYPQLLGKEAKEAFETSDVIFSKGMGNAETLLGCGKNIYYAFLVKCAHFSEMMQKPLMTPMLLHEGDR